MRTEPIFINSITDGNGAVLESYDPQPTEAIDRTTAYLVTSLLESVVKEGTGKGALGLGKPVAGKTGTTNNYVDAWFMGYAPSIVTGVWVGYDNPKASLGDRETGARAALPHRRGPRQAQAGPRAGPCANRSPSSKAGGRRPPCRPPSR